MLTLADIKEIQADAEKAITRQFRDASEDHGWEPTATPDLDSGTHLVDEPAAADAKKESK